MAKRNPIHVVRRHTERFITVDELFQCGRYSMALEILNHVLRDKQLPPQLRLQATLKTVEALLGLERVVEAHVAAQHAENLVERHGLQRWGETVKEVVSRARTAL